MILKGAANACESPARAPPLFFRRPSDEETASWILSPESVPGEIHEHDGCRFFSAQVKDLFGGDHEFHRIESPFL